MKQIAIVFQLGIMAFFISSCTSNKYAPVNPNTPSHEVGYTTHIKPIVDNFCITCHGGNSPSANLALNTYEDVRKAAEKGLLLKRINDQAHPMPVGGLMPKNERVIFNKWKANTFLEVGKLDSSTAQTPEYTYTPKPVVPVDITQTEVQLLTQMQGHWVGEMVLMGEKIPWFAWDFRPIASAHVHGLFEGGSMGNLFTSFFIADFKGTTTIMARNGGILNGIYRTSYFVLDQAKTSNGESYYRLVDAYGNAQIMYMELRIKNDELTFSSHTSRFGTYPSAKKHMNFKGKRMHEELSIEAAKKVKFPDSEIQYNFANGLPTPIWEGYPTISSASYLWQDVSVGLEELGKLSKDPIPLSKMPFVSSAKIEWDLPENVKEKNTQVYLSRKPLTNEAGKMKSEYGYIEGNSMNEVLLFSEINPGLHEFQYHYLHPGEYYVTLWIDNDGNKALSTGDHYATSVKLEVTPSSSQTFKLVEIPENKL